MDKLKSRQIAVSLLLVLGSVLVFMTTLAISETSSRR